MTSTAHRIIEQITSLSRVYVIINLYKREVTVWFEIRGNETKPSTIYEYVNDLSKGFYYPFVAEAIQIDTVTVTATTHNIKRSFSRG